MNKTQKIQNQSGGLKPELKEKNINVISALFYGKKIAKSAQRPNN